MSQESSTPAGRVPHLSLVQPAQQPDPLLPVFRRRVRISTHEHETVAEAISSLASCDPNVYQRGGKLVRVRRETVASDDIVRRPGTPVIDLLPRAALRERMSAAADWGKDLEIKGRTEFVEEHVPEWAVREIDARGEWPGIRPISGVTDIPVLRPDGSVVETPGYDSATGVLFEPTLEFPPVPRNPSPQDAAAAGEYLVREVLADFPFAPGKTRLHHVSTALAAILTPLARAAFRGPSPLFVLDATTPGSGKNMLGDVIGLVTTGGTLPRMPYTKSDEETRKRITSLAVAGDRVVLIDNIDGTLGCASLDAALTADVWHDRILGGNGMFRGPLSVTWYATGNNVQIGGDTARRTLRIRLVPNVERPEERSGFRHSDLLGWISENRARLVVAGLTLLRAYFVAGRPTPQLQAFGSFEGWSSVVRSALCWLGAPDPVETGRELRLESDQTRDQLATLLSVWAERFPNGATASHATTAAKNDADLNSTLEEFAPGPGGRVSSRSLGNRLKLVRGRIVDGRCLDGGKDRNGIQVWCVRAAGSAGSAGSVSTPVHPVVNTNPYIIGELKVDPADPADPAEG